MPFAPHAVRVRLLAALACSTNKAWLVGNPSQRRHLQTVFAGLALAERAATHTHFVGARLVTSDAAIFGIHLTHSLFVEER